MYDDLEDGGSSLLSAFRRNESPGAAGAATGSPLSTMSPIATVGGTALLLGLMAAGLWAVLPSAPKTSGGPKRPRARTAGAPGDIKTDGMLLKAVQNQTYQPISWVQIPGPAGMTITVAADLLKAPGPPPDGPMLRLPASYDETIAIAKLLSNQLGFGVITPDKQIADAIYKNATVRTAFHTQVLKPGDALGMPTLQFSVNNNNDMDAQIAAALGGPPASNTLVSGTEKLFILDPRLDYKINAEFLARTGLPPPPVSDPRAMNYGGWNAAGVPVQSVGGVHNYQHSGDYSQMMRPVQRMAIDANGNPVDLLSWMETADGIPSKYTDMFRFDDTSA